MSRKGKAESKNQSRLRTGLWALASAMIAALSIYAVFRQADHVSFRQILNQISSMRRGWLAAAIACMVGYILFEACAIRQSVRLVGGSGALGKSWIYAAADIYFSAITPSATGGQPASAFLMLQDGISAAQTTAALLLNLFLYAVSLVVIGLLCFLTRAPLLLCFGPAARMLIVVGVAVQLALSAFFLLLIRKDRLLQSMGEKLIHLLCKLPFLRQEDRYLQKFHRVLAQYRTCLQLLSDHKREMWSVFLYNFLQRASQIAVTMCVYLAWGSGTLAAFDLWVLQSLVLLGANYIPIPGGMGVTDYLMLDGFSTFFSANQAVSLELISRSISFYSCILICGCFLLLRLGLWAIKRKEPQ